VNVKIKTMSKTGYIRQEYRETPEQRKQRINKKLQKQHKDKKNKSIDLCEAEDSDEFWPSFDGKLGFPRECRTSSSFSIIFH
jgi:hypothetical protein